MGPVLRLHVGMESKPKRFSRLRLAYILLFGAFYGAWAIAQLGDDRNWIVAMAGTGVAGIVWPPALVAAVLLSIRRRWADLGVVACLLGVLLVLSGQLRWPHVRVSAKGAPTIRVMTFNVEHGWHGVEKIAETVRSQNVDAFCMQELGTGEDASTIDELRRLLPDYSLFSDGSRTSGTRLPVLRQRSILLTNEGWGWTMIEQVVRFDGHAVRVLNVHAPSYQPGPTRRRPFPQWLTRWGELSVEQHRLIDIELGHIASDATPTVLCGDFNMPATGSRYRKLASLATDVFAAVGSGTGWTMPSGLPMRRIDYVWAFPGLEPLEAHVVDRRASDHAAVIASLALKR